MEFIGDVSEIIQIAVAPVFLLAGVAGFLSVMSGRLGRIIDRVRVVEQRRSKFSGEGDALILDTELAILKRRTRVTNHAIGLCTSAGLSVCLLVLSIFIGGFFEQDVGTLIVGLFAAAMLLLIGSLVFFLREISLATQTLEVASEFGAD